MKRVLMIIAAFGIIGTAGCTAADSQVNRLSPREAREWLCYTVPLPKQIEISAEAVVPRGSVGLEIKSEGKHPVYSQIREEFVDACGPNAAEIGEPAFWISFQVGGDQAEPLKKLANCEQAYGISPSEDNKSLVITCLTHRGAYYGWKTVQQLIKGRSGSDTLRIPILTVIDWPDMEKRGLWGTDNFNHIEWLADRKINHLEQITAQGVDEEGNFYAYTRNRPNEHRLILDAPSFAVDYAPVVLHLEQRWDPKNMGKFYPQIKAKNATHPGALCYSEPKTTEMISEWIYLLAKESPTTEVDVWLTENLAGRTGCACEGCSKEHHTVNEARVVVKAWEMAKQKLGRYITLYILTSEATEDYNQKIFSELPKDIRVWYYHSLLTYNSIRQPMLLPYLGEFAKTNWLGVCPNLDAWVHNNVPCSSAHFIHYRMDEFVTKGLKGLLGYATPRVHFNRFNVEAAAEWTWNLKGRSTRDFAYSYAVRQGYGDPAKFAEWSEAIGPVEWDVYGSNWPAGQKRGQGVKVGQALKNGTLPPLGYVMGSAWPTPWGNIKSERQLNADVAAARKALALAKQMNIPQYIYETLVADGYIRTLKALYELKKLAPEGRMFAPAVQRKARNQLKEFLAAANQVVENLPKWESCVTTEEEKDFNFVEKPVSIMKEVAEDIKAVAVEMGVKVD